MNHLRTRVLAGVFALLMCMTALLSIPMALGAEPAEVSFGAPAIAVAVTGPAVATIGDNVFVIGGSPSYLDTLTALDIVQIYNVKTGETTYGARMPTGVGAAACGVGPDGKIYVVGGWNSTASTYILKVQIYDPALDSWTQVSGSIPAPVGLSAYAMAPDGNLYIFGNGWSTNETLIYNTQTNSWRYGADQPSNGFSGSAVVYNSTAVFLIGGVYGGASAAVHIYNPVANTWSNAGSLLDPEAYGSSVLARNGFIYEIGGSLSTSRDYASPYSSVERYNVSSDEWEYAGASLGSGNMNAGVVLDTYGRILVVGGWGGSSAVNTVQYIVTSSIAGVSIMEISSPQAGSVVSGITPVQVGIVNGYGGGFFAIDFFVDGLLKESRLWGPSATFLWNTSGLADGSMHTLMARGYNPDGTVSEASVVVTVSAHSLEEKIATLQQGIADLQAKLGQTDTNVTQLKADLAALQAQLTGLQLGLVAMGNSQAAAGAQLNATLVNLQKQLDDFKTQIDRVETKADSGGTMSLLTIVLIVVIVVLLLVLMFRPREPRRDVVVEREEVVRSERP